MNKNKKSAKKGSNGSKAAPIKSAKTKRPYTKKDKSFWGKNGKQLPEDHIDKQVGHNGLTRHTDTEVSLGVAAMNVIIPTLSVEEKLWAVQKLLKVNGVK